MKNLPELWRSERLDPFRMITHMQRKMDRLFGEMFGDPYPVGSFERESAYAFSPPCDLDETDTHFLITMDLPGMSKEDVKIELKDHLLFISGERKEERRDDRKSQQGISKKRPQYIERDYGAFQRVLTLPSGVNMDRVEAKFQNGVLSISLPKVEISKAKLIKIEEPKEKVHTEKAA